jgi:hypothetical protein
MTFLQGYRYHKSDNLHKVNHNTLLQSVSRIGMFVTGLPKSAVMSLALAMGIEGVRVSAFFGIIPYELGHQLMLSQSEEDRCLRHGIRR